MYVGDCEEEDSLVVLSHSAAQHIVMVSFFPRTKKCLDDITTSPSSDVSSETLSASQAGAESKAAREIDLWYDS